MAHVLALYDVDDVFGDVGGVIADALEILGDQNEFESRKHNAGIAHHIGEQLAEDLIAVVIHLVVAFQDFAREIDVAADHCVQGVADHFFGDFAHAWQVDVRLDAWMAENSQGALRDVDGLIADAFEIVIDARNGQDETQVHGHELVQSEKLNDAIVNFDLQLVDGAFFFEDALGKLLVGIQHGVDGLMDSAFGEAAHPEQPLFQFVQISFEVTFHRFLPAACCLQNN